MRIPSVIRDSMDGKTIRVQMEFFVPQVPFEDLLGSNIPSSQHPIPCVLRKLHLLHRTFVLFSPLCQPSFNLLHEQQTICCPLFVFFFFTTTRTTFDNFFFFSSEPCEEPSCCPLLFCVVPVVVSSLFVPSPARNYSCKFVSFVVKNVPSLARNPLVVPCCLLLFLLSFLLFSFRAPRGTPCCPMLL